MHPPPPPSRPMRSTLRHELRVRVWVCMCAVALLSAACSGGGAEVDEAGRIGPGGQPATSAEVGTTSGSVSTAPATAPPTSTPPPPLAGLTPSLTPLAVEGDPLESPIDLVPRPGSTRMWLAERAGRVGEVAIEGDTLTRTGPRVDLADRVGSTDSERGLLGIAFHPDGDRLFVSYTRAEDGASVVERFDVDDDGALDAATGRVVLTVAQPAGNHNGGDLAFGPDGYLYLGLGDGGGAGDRDGNGQRPSTLLGSMLRIDVDAEPYRIPADNPFAAGGDGAPEVWLWGVRNPWRFSFDPATGDLWVADVGQGEREEVNRLPADGGRGAGRGANLGWNLREGDRPYPDAPDDVTPIGPLTDPVHAYGHDDGCSVTGGLVYRGSSPDLQGTYLFADYCTPGLRALRPAAGGVPEVHRYDLPTAQTVSFGASSDGTVYLVAIDQGILRLDP